MSGSLPRIAPTTIERVAITQWLLEHADLPLRLCLGPAGSGKTSALVAYCRQIDVPRAYVHLRRVNDEQALQSSIARALGLEGFDYDAVLTYLTRQERFELVVDGIDRVPPGASEILENLLADIPETVALIYAGTSSVLEVHRAVATGVAVTLPREAYAFDAKEIADLCEQISLPMHDDAVLELIERTDGWPVVVCDVLRCAAQTQTSLIDAYPRWLVQRGRSFSVYVHEELARLPHESLRLFERALTKETLTPVELQQLEDAGAPVVVAGAAYHAYRVVEDLDLELEQETVEQGDRLTIRMFGRFVMKSGETEISWIRRRDQQLFRYLALRPGGTAPKKELLEIFWPDADPQLGAQSLRTACSNIRKVLNAVIGSAATEQLFSTEGNEIKVDLSSAIVDLYRFKAHVHAAKAEEDEENVGGAFAHYRAAEELYRADLFSGEPDEAWFLPQREIYRTMLGTARDRVLAIATEFGEEELAKEVFRSGEYAT